MSHRDIARYLAIGVAASAVAIWAVNSRYEPAYKALVLDRWTGDTFTTTTYYEKPEPQNFQEAKNPFGKLDSE